MGQKENRKLGKPKIYLDEELREKIRVAAKKNNRSIVGELRERFKSPQ